VEDLPWVYSRGYEVDEEYLVVNHSLGLSFYLASCVHIHYRNRTTCEI
jgi:hypothetical protein